MNNTESNVYDYIFYGGWLWQFRLVQISMLCKRRALYGFLVQPLSRWDASAFVPKFMTTDIKQEPTLAPPSALHILGLTVVNCITTPELDIPSYFYPSCFNEKRKNKKKCTPLHFLYIEFVIY